MRQCVSPRTAILFESDAHFCVPPNNARTSPAVHYQHSSARYLEERTFDEFVAVDAGTDRVCKDSEYVVSTAMPNLASYAFLGVHGTGTWLCLHRLRVLGRD